MSVAAVLRFARTRTRLPEPDAAPMLLAFRTQNRPHQAPWEPVRDVRYQALEDCQRAIAEANEAAPRGVVTRC